MLGRRILIDGTMTNRGGGFTFLSITVPEVARLAPSSQFRVVVGDRLLFESIPSSSNLEVIYLGDLGLIDRFLFTFRHASRMAKSWKADIYLAAGEVVPPDAPCPTVAMFQNPNTFNLGQGQDFPVQQKARLYLLHGLARIAARTCRRIIFVSDDSARWIGDRIKLPHAKRRVVKNGIDAKVWRQPQAPPPDEIETDYILSVSSIYSYKNYVRLIEAWTELARRRPEIPDLVIIGDCRDKTTSRRIGKARYAAGELAERVHILGEVPYSRIRSYYDRASLFVFPSYLETFGIPLIEAMASKTPIVASDIPIFREVAGDSALFADPFRPASMANAIEKALYETHTADTLVKRGQVQVRQFALERTASRMIEVLSEVIEESDPNR